jgi:hypothetical protein
MWSVVVLLGVAAACLVLCGCGGKTSIEMFGFDLVTPLGSLKIGMDKYDADRPVDDVKFVPPEPEDVEVPEPAPPPE